MQNKYLFLSPFDLEKQEHLSINIIKKLHPIKCVDLLDRPKENLIDLIKWVEINFKDNLSKNENICTLINNQIIIDGQFLKFCDIKNVKVSCLIQDSIVSWKTDNNFEKFFMQGVFLIKGNDFEFLHAALFHKGNQNEDEISFFVLVDACNYEKYISFRNEFQSWTMQRDRENLHIRVIDGNDINYTKDHSWDDLFLNKSIKSDIKFLVESFLSSKDFYNSKRIPWKRGVLLYGPPGNGKTSLIRTIISNYNFKPVTIAPLANDEMICEAFSYAEEHSPSLLYFEDLDSLLDRIDVSSFLNLMDGVSAPNGMLIIATANNVKKLKPNVINRPSRFDRKFEIPLPDENMCILFLKKWFGKTISLQKIKQLAKLSVKNEFSYAYLKELYISSMFEAISKNRDKPSLNDIDKAYKNIVKEKKFTLGDKINTEKYL
jgi:AAA+ superfamily predicted ATPase